MENKKQGNHPKKQYPTPPYPAQEQVYPGLESAMKPHPYFGKGTYNSSDKLRDKVAIINFTRGLSQEVIQKGIRVNAVAPGPVWTPLILSTLGKKSTPEFGKNTVFGRPAQPIELAPIYVFLASDEASYITGQTYGATGYSMP